MNTPKEMNIEHRRTLICGLGSIGRKHLRTIKKLDPGHEVALLRSGKGGDYEEEKNAEQVFSCMEDAINWKPQAAIICTPATDHLTTAVQLTRKNIPTLIEKPISNNLEKKELWDELEKRAHSVPVLVGYVLRHDACANLVREKMNKKTLGTIIEADFYCGSWLPDWRAGQDYRSCVSARHELGGGVLLELSHEIDLAQWLLGPISLEHTYIGNSGLLEINVEDQAILFGRTTHKTPVTIRLNFCTSPSKRTMVIRGSNGEIHWDLVKGKVEIRTNSSANSGIARSSTRGEERYENQTNHFFACVNNQCKPICTVRDGIEVIELIEKAKEMYSRGEKK